jgi:hypothetical protein
MSAALVISHWSEWVQQGEVNHCINLVVVGGSGAMFQHDSL